MKNQRQIRIKKARENNLKDLSLNVPLNKLIVVTGVSGSGKSSLVFDTIAKEGQRRYLQSFSSYARQFAGKVAKPDVESISGLTPVIALSQKAGAHSPRSTVGTMSEVYDHLRLIFARFGAVESRSEDFPKVNRSLFSFNTEKGACPTCKGLGLEEKIDLDKLIADPTKTLRDGALVPTTPNGYIVYSQITVDVLNTICEAHGFNVDIAWKDLTEEQKNVVLFGSDRLKVPFGKHSLESRLKWSGITAKPREEDYYRGMLPVMEGILKRDRNKNILRFVSAVTCTSCDGSRLRQEALQVRYNGKNIADASKLTIKELKVWLTEETHSKSARIVVDKLVQRLDLLLQLSLSYLTIDRAADTLSGGEVQRIRLAVQAGSKLRGVLYVFDEPSIGLHAHDNQNMLRLLRQLVNQGNTVIVVEHDEETMHHADWIIDIGPDAGEAGGHLLFNGPAAEFFAKPVENSHTSAFYHGKEKVVVPEKRRKGNGNLLKIKGASANNLKGVDAAFPLGVFNAVTGVSGSGKSTLVNATLGAALHQQLQGAQKVAGAYEGLHGVEHLDKIISINQSPIGRTPRSNPATYTGLFDYIRDLYAGLEESKKRKYKKGRFSFNNKGGRCENCQGAGAIQIGMHFLGNVDVHCPVCDGKRFNDETLEVTYEGKNIREVLDLRVDEAVAFFANEKKLLRVLLALQNVGLGYLKLGQPSTTLSGGEAQRVKLASELQRPSTGKTLYILDEPTTGLHSADIQVLLKALNALVEKGNTLVVIEHNLDVVWSADYVLDLGPESGKGGGEIVGVGTPEQIAKLDTLTGKALAESGRRNRIDHGEFKYDVESPIKLKGVQTHNLKNIDVEFPINELTVITGVSGSGKSSLAFDTLYAEAHSRFIESMGTYNRRFLQKANQSDVAEVEGLTPAIGLQQNATTAHPRSTVGTVSELYDLYRLLYSRAGIHPEGQQFSAAAFSFNQEVGACPKCKGLGSSPTASPALFINDPTKPIAEGAMAGHKPGKFYGDPFGQHIAILKTAAAMTGIDISKPWKELSEAAQTLVLEGTGDQVYDVEWHYKNKSREGVQQLQKPWLGFVYYYTEEFERKHEQKGGDPLRPLMIAQKCNVCDGQRLKPQILAVKLADKSIGNLANTDIESSFEWFSSLSDSNNSLTKAQQKIGEEAIAEILERLSVLLKLGLGYLTIDRSSATLSGGELQRLQLARQLAADLSGVTYVLDEPTSGLHHRDTKRLIEVLKSIVENGNTMLVVSHNKTLIKSASHIIEIGPGSGVYGGALVGAGSVAALANNADSKTGPYLASRNHIEIASKSAAKEFSKVYLSGLEIRNLSVSNLSLNSGLLNVVSGVSGSGKSTLVFDVLLASVEANRAMNCVAVENLDLLGEIVSVNQSPIRANSNSTPATFLGVFDAIRTRFSKSEKAKELGLKKDHFSYLHKNGRCPECGGKGEVKISLDFIADLMTTCEVCDGSRYQNTPLECKIEGKSIADVLQMPTQEALAFFQTEENITEQLQHLIDAGLHYLPLGHSIAKLSGGESQRLKLAKALNSKSKERTTFVFDEPTRGLHFEDVDHLINMFQKLTAQGNTLIVIEHHPQVILAADHVIDLGPEGGAKGGQLVFQGTVANLLNNEQSYTAKALKEYLVN